MSDTALHEPTALPALSDAPPSSAGRSSGTGAVDQPPPQAAISDELKARLDKVIYSEVSANGAQGQTTAVAQQSRIMSFMLTVWVFACRSVSLLSLLD
jgi:hypothetical protein